MTLFATNSEFPIAFHIGDLAVRWYGIISVIGYLVAICIFMLSIKFRYKVAADPAFYYIFIAIPCILLGARFWSCAIGDADWKNFFNFQTGGLAIQGGVVFGVISALIYFPLILRKPKYHQKVVDGENTYILRPSLWIYADAIIPTILIGQAIGRWGNFFNGEIFGNLITTDPNSANSLTWLKYFMPGVYDHMIAQVGGINLTAGALYQPLFLYESTINVFVFILIYLLLPNFRQIKIGTISTLYFVSYGITRFAMEPLRFSSYKFTGTFVINGILLTIGIVLFVFTQFLLPIYFRKYKVFEIVKMYINRNKYSKKLTLKNIIDKNVRSESEGIYYANR